MLSCELLAILIALIIAISKGMVRVSGTSPPKSVKTNVATILRNTDGVEEIRVTKAGSDTTGDGSRTKPYLTVNHANSVASEFAHIHVESGNYDEEADISVDGVVLIMHKGAIIDTTTNGGTSLTLSGDNVRLVGVKLDYSGVGPTTNILRITGDFCDIGEVNLENNSGQVVTHMINVVSGAARAKIDVFYVNGMGDATNGIATVENETIISTGGIVNVTNGIVLDGDYAKLKDISILATTGLMITGDHNRARGMTFNCTTDVNNTGTGNVVERPEDIPRWGTPVNATSAQPSDNAGTVSYPINLTVTKESKIHIHVRITGVPTNDTLTLALQIKQDGTNWINLALFTAVGGVLAMEGIPAGYEVLALTQPQMYLETFINSSTDFRLSLVQVGSADAVGEITYTYNTLEKQ